jgi:hypothetical protein
LKELNKEKPCLTCDKKRYGCWCKKYQEWVDYEPETQTPEQRLQKLDDFDIYDEDELRQIIQEIINAKKPLTPSEQKQLNKLKFQERNFSGLQRKLIKRLYEKAMR